MVDRAKMVQFGKYAVLSTAALVTAPYLIKGAIEFLPGILFVGAASFAGIKLIAPALKAVTTRSVQLLSNAWSGLTSRCGRLFRRGGNDGVEPNLVADDSGVDADKRDVDVVGQALDRDSDAALIRGRRSRSPSRGSQSSSEEQNSRSSSPSSRNNC